MADFTSFEQAANYIKEKELDFAKIKKNCLHEVGRYMRRAIQDMHGVQQAGWLKSTLNPTPLLKTGGLRQAVSFMTKTDSVVVYSKMEWLALIHEFGVTWKMTDKQRSYLFGVVFEDQKKGAGRPRNTWGSGYIRIPPRPIWRRVLELERSNIDSVILAKLNTLF